MLIPVLLALTAAVLFGFNMHVQNRALDDTDPLFGALLSVGATALMFWVFSPFMIDWSWWFTRAATLFIIAGLMFPAAGQTLQIASIRRIGPALTSAVGAFVPAFAVLPSVLFLAEPFGIQASIGMALMIGGLVLSALGGRRIRRDWPIWALALPLGAAMVRGFVQPLVKYAYAFVHSPYFATMVTASVSTLVLLVLVALRRRQGPLRVGAAGRRLFAVSGVINGLGILSLNQAIGMGQVTVAAPLASTAPLFALLFGALVFRREVLGWRHLVIALMAVGGAMLIVTR
jgi:DME family drug/metabolite transporter